MLLSSKHVHSFGVDAEAGPDHPRVTLNLRLKAELQLCSVSSLDPTHSSPSCHFFWPLPEGHSVCRRPRGWTLLRPADWWLGALLPACSSPRFIPPAENLTVLRSLFRSLSRLSDTRGSFLHLRGPSSSSSSSSIFLYWIRAALRWFQGPLVSGFLHVECFNNCVLVSLFTCTITVKHTKVFLLSLT